MGLDAIAITLQSNIKLVPSKTRHQKLPWETGGQNGASIAKFCTQRPEPYPRNAAVPKDWGGVPMQRPRSDRRPIRGCPLKTRSNSRAFNRIDFRLIGKSLEA